MLRPSVFRRLQPSHFANFALIRSPMSSSAFQSKPRPALRILFCGSDNFSAKSLEAIVKAKDEGLLPVQSLNVVCRPPKRTGRGLKQVTEVPIVSVAERLKLPVHAIDTFTGWAPPSKARVNLIVAVSFGLLIPERIIQGAEFGGLNVHPSVLPDFRGAAPIEHALFKGLKTTGVSLQTLHPTKFDHGMVVGQTAVSIEDLDDNVDKIKERLGGVGAEILVKGLQDRVFLEPREPIQLETYPDGSPVQRRKAYKIAAEDSYVDFECLTAKQIITRQKVLRNLWSTIITGPDPKTQSSRVKWTGEFTEVNHTFDKLEPQWNLQTRAGKLIIPTARGTSVAVEGMTLPGKPERTVREVMQILKLTEQSSAQFLSATSRSHTSERRSAA